MAIKKLTVQDVLNDSIDSRAFQAPAQKESKPAAKRSFRIRTGQYTALMDRTEITMLEVGEQAGRKMLNIGAKLYDGEQYVGMSFFDISWSLHTQGNGEPDLKFRLFQQVIHALGAPQTAELADVLEAIPGEYFTVWGKEYFVVKGSDLLPMDAKLNTRGPSAAVYVFINDGENDKAEKYAAAGYKSRFKVMRISALSDNN